jgi:hypothetical protein
MASGATDQDRRGSRWCGGQVVVFVVGGFPLFAPGGILAE